MLLLLTLVLYCILSPMYSDSLPSLMHNSNLYVHWLVPTVNQTKLLPFALTYPSSSKILKRLVFCSLFKLTILQLLKLSLSNKRKKLKTSSSSKLPLKKWDLLMSLMMKIMILPFDQLGFCNITVLL